MGQEENRISRQQDNQPENLKSNNNNPFSTLQDQHINNCKKIMETLDDEFYEEKAELFFPMFLEKIETEEWDDQMIAQNKSEIKQKFGTHHINVNVSKIGETSSVYHDIMTPGKQAWNMYVTTRKQADQILPKIVAYSRNHQIKDAKKLFKQWLQLSDTSKIYLNYYNTKKKTEETIKYIKERPN